MIHTQPLRPTRRFEQPAWPPAAAAAAARHVPSRGARMAYAAGVALDMLLGVFSPRLAAARMNTRATLSQIETFATGIGGYDAGKLDRSTKGRPASRINENAVPLQQVQRLRFQAYDVFRNNPHAKKLLRTLEAKVVGPGLKPQSHAVKRSGKPHKKFREAAQKLWQDSQRSIDYRGRPSKGGQHGSDLQKTAFRSAVLSGDLLWREKPLTTRQMIDREAIVPLAVQLIHTERLAEYLTLTGEGKQHDRSRLFRGLEIDTEGLVSAYWILRYHPTDPMMFLSVQEADRYDVSEIGHAFVSDDIDQYRGTSWLASVLNPLRDTGDYSYSELKAAALRACVAFWYHPPTGMPNGIGVQMPSEWELTDADGNPITAVQPGMLMNMGRDGELHMENPGNGASNNAEAWISYMLRSLSTGLPGVKASTITGDYRESSYSSEKSADNDAWPELEGVQQWFGHSFCQPVYESVIRAGFLAGYFDGILRAEEFAERPGDFLRCSWQGPVARSINPELEAKAATARIAGGTSTVEIEAGAQGRSAADILKANEAWIKQAVKHGMPEAWIWKVLGIEVKDTITGTAESSGADDDDVDGKKKKRGDPDPASRIPWYAGAN